MSLFTCVTCNVAFNDPDVQREHYKSDWHRYNLKRKVAELAPITFESFHEKVQQQKNQENAQTQKVDELFCKLCQKPFLSNSYTKHVESNKHKDLVQKLAGQQKEEEYIIKSDRAAKKAQQQEQELQRLHELQEKLDKEEQAAEEENIDESILDAKEWEDVGDEDDDQSMLEESKGIDLKTCLFCEHKSDSLEGKCDHMAKTHSFFIPDAEYVSDMEGLLKFLGIKVGAYHVCLWCSRKCYRDLKSCQKHMNDKGHHKMRFESETLIEYADFYTYPGDMTIEDEYEIVNRSDFINISQLSAYNGESEYDESTGDLGDETFELVLPSGAKIGHRSLFKYYKQSFGHRNLELKQKSNLTVRDKYKAIANNGNYSCKK
jgi:pre-60S factor REI1